MKIAKKSSAVEFFVDELVLDFCMTVWQGIFGKFIFSKWIGIRFFKTGMEVSKSENRPF